MHGLSNDYFYVDIDNNDIADLAQFAQVYSDRRTGIGMTITTQGAEATSACVSLMQMAWRG